MGKKNPEFLYWNSGFFIENFVLLNMCFDLLYKISFGLGAN
jgi:hypothetical protein